MLADASPLELRLLLHATVEAPRIARIAADDMILQIPIMNNFFPAGSVIPVMRTPKRNANVKNELEMLQCADVCLTIQRQL